MRNLFRMDLYRLWHGGTLWAAPLSAVGLMVWMYVMISLLDGALDGMTMWEFYLEAQCRGSILAFVVCLAAGSFCVREFTAGYSKNIFSGAAGAGRYLAARAAALLVLGAATAAAMAGAALLLAPVTTLRATGGTPAAWLEALAQQCLLGWALALLGQLAALCLRREGAMVVALCVAASGLPVTAADLLCRRLEWPALGRCLLLGASALVGSGDVYPWATPHILLAGLAWGAVYLALARLALQTRDVC